VELMIQDDKWSDLLFTPVIENYIHSKPIL
jgi:hypothetical protein